MRKYLVRGGNTYPKARSCPQIDNNQQVYEAQIQVPSCNSIFKAVHTTEDNIHTLRWVALIVWSVCSPVHRSRWGGLSVWHPCEPALQWQPEPLNRNESGRLGALKSDSTHHFFRNACTKSGSLRFSQFSGCW
jgi:hypothetical protein